MKVCVFCGSSPGKNPAYLNLATSIGKGLAEKGHELIYGGASIGVMGKMADSALDAGGKVHGIMPTKLVNMEVAHKGLTSFEEVEDMHVRKAKMYQEADAFVALPGGMGTLDELCEIITWAQIAYHNKPIFIVNYGGFYDLFIDHLRHVVNEGFMADNHMNLISVVDDIDQIFDLLEE